MKRVKKLVAKNRNRFFLFLSFSLKLTAGRFVEVDVDALELEVRVALVAPCFFFRKSGEIEKERGGKAKKGRESRG